MPCIGHLTPVEKSGRESGPHGWRRDPHLKVRIYNDRDLLLELAAIICHDFGVDHALDLCFDSCRRERVEA